MHLRIPLIGLLLALAPLLAGCSNTSHEKQTAMASKPHAECLVCKHNADLACIDVDVDKDTPSYVQDGKTYYFCSKGCRDKFAKDPAKYLSSK